jgi:U3 small nucleolar RNA-associated protein 7
MYQKEIKERAAKYNRDPLNDLEASKKRVKNRGGVARRKQREERAQQRRMPKSDDPKLQATLQRQELQYQEAEENAARAELLLLEETGILEAEGEMEKTYKFKQSEIRKAVNILTSRKIFDLSLPDYGPYCSIDYTQSGRHFLMGGRKGHLAVIDANTNALLSEVHVRETIRDVSFLHDFTMYAVAQRKYVYIYDQKGIELHCLRHHIEPTRIEFLPYHFLMVSAGHTGYIKWQDTSTGQLVTETRTKLGKCKVLRQNPYNACVSAGHANGTVTMWSPSMPSSLVKLLCHRGPVMSIAHDIAGKYMVTTGLDKQMKVWDIRMYRPLHNYYTSTPGTSIDISQKDMIAVSYGSHIQVWKDGLRIKQKSPYMKHATPGSALSKVRFRPYEDSLLFGHQKGISSIVVPGSGEPNFDSYAANPFETNKQRRENTVQNLLDKLQPEMIQLDPNNIGRVDRTPQDILASERKKSREANAAIAKANKKVIKKTRGRNKLGKRIKRKARNIVTKERMLRVEQSEKRKRDEANGNGNESGDNSKRSKHGAALGVFGKQKKATRSRTK